MTTSSSVSPDLARLPDLTRVLWRSSDTVQLELGERRAVLSGTTAADVRALHTGAPAAHLSSVRAALRRLGLLTHSRPLRSGWASPRASAQLADELRALTGRADDAAGRLERRRTRWVEVRGTPRLATAVAAGLAACGIGRVTVGAGESVQRPLVTMSDVLPGGLQPGDEGSVLSQAMTDAVLRAAPDALTAPADLGEPHLIVCCAGGAAPPAQPRPGASAYLPVTAWANLVTVGPLVVPDRPGCLQCQDRHRRDRDPAWSVLAAALAHPIPGDEVAETTVALLAVAASTAQAVDFLDGDEPACVAGSLELARPDWRWRRRPRPAHPECGCAAVADRPSTAVAQPGPGSTSMGELAG